MKQKFIVPTKRAGQQPPKGLRKAETRVFHRPKLSATMVFVAAMAASVCLESAAAASKDRLEQDLAQARAQLAQMQSKLDKWLMNAATREEEVEQQLTRRDARIAQLSVLLSEQRKQLNELRAAKLSLEKQKRAQSEQTGNSTPAPPQMRARLRTIEAELANLQRETRSREHEREKLLAYAEQLENHINERDGALLAAREAVLESKRELDRRAAEIERLRKTLKGARSSEPSADNGAGVAERGSDAAGNSQTVRESVPPDALSQARAGARASALNYLRLRDREFPPDGRTRPDRPEVHQAFRKMFAHQARVASLTGAGGLYQVRVNDTLSLVAERTTGERKNWPALFTANEHLMASPNELIDGLVLIIPAP